MNTQHTKHVTIGEGNPSLTFHVLQAVAARRARELRRKVLWVGFLARIRSFGKKP